MPRATAPTRLAALKRFRREYPGFGDDGRGAPVARRRGARVQSTCGSCRCSRRLFADDAKARAAAPARRGPRTSGTSRWMQSRITRRSICDSPPANRRARPARSSASCAAASEQTILRLLSISVSRTRPCYSARKDWNDARNEYAAPDAESFRCRSRTRATAHSRMRSGAGFAGPQKWRRFKSAIPMWTPNVSTLSRNIIGRSKQESQMVAAVEGVVSACAVEPLGRIRAIPGRKLLLGAARSRSRGELLQTARGKFPDVNKRACRAVARRVGGHAETAAGSCRRCCRIICGAFRDRRTHRMRSIGLAAWRKTQESRRSRAATTRNWRSAIRRIIFRPRPAARAHAVGVGPVEKSDVLDSIPAVAAIPKLDGPIPLAADRPAGARGCVAFDRLRRFGRT